MEKAEDGSCSTRSGGDAFPQEPSHIRFLDGRPLRASSISEPLAEMARQLSDYVRGPLPSRVAELCQLISSKCPPAEQVENLALHALCGAPEGLKSDGRSLWIEFEGRCNWRCKFCYNSYRNGAPPAGASVDDMLRVVRELADTQGVASVCVAGGEPLLRADLERLVSGLSEMGLQVAIATNAHNLSTERIVNLQRAGCTLFQVAVHALNPSTHDGLTSVGGSWLRAMQGLLNCMRERAPVVPVFVATAKNVHEFPAFVDMMAAIGLPKVVFNRFVPAGYGASNAVELDINSADVRQALARSNEIALRGNILVRMGVPVAINVEDLVAVEAASCSVASTHGDQLVIGLDGRLRQCAADYSGLNRSYQPKAVGEPCLRREEWQPVTLGGS